MIRVLGMAILLSALTAGLAVASFRVWHRDFFWLHSVYQRPAPADRDRLLRIAAGVNYRDPRNTALSMMLGEALRRAGEPDRGLRILAVQAAAHPDDLGIQRAYADALSDTGKRQEADAVYRDILRKLEVRNSPTAAHSEN